MLFIWGWHLAQIFSSAIITVIEFPDCQAKNFASYVMKIENFVKGCWSIPKSTRGGRRERINRNNRKHFSIIIINTSVTLWKTYQIIITSDAYMAEPNREEKSWWEGICPLYIKILMENLSEAENFVKRQRIQFPCLSKINIHKYVAVHFMFYGHVEYSLAF